MDCTSIKDYSEPDNTSHLFQVILVIPIIPSGSQVATIGPSHRCSSFGCQTTPDSSQAVYFSSLHHIKDSDFHDPAASHLNV